MMLKISSNVTCEIQIPHRYRRDTHQSIPLDKKYQIQYNIHDKPILPREQVAEVQVGGRAGDLQIHSCI